MNKSKEAICETTSANEKTMIGAIVGDIVGSRVEFANHKGRDFELLIDKTQCFFDGGIGRCRGVQER